MVQILIHIRPADIAGSKCYELIDCSTETRIEALKQTIADLGAASGRYSLPVKEQELVFMGERCSNSKALLDYGICHDFIKQVTGFVVNPDEPGKRFVEGRLVPCDT